MMVKFQLDQGSTFLKVIEVKDAAGLPVDLTGVTAKMQIRKSYTDASVLKEITDLSGITIDPLLGRMTLRIEESDTKNFTQGNYVFDLETKKTDGFVQKILKGTISVFPEVTK